ncbi:MAG: glycosyltransferase family 2 protein [Bacteroidales bacterium]
MRRLLIIIPAFNEADSIEDLLDEIETVKLPLQVDTIVINDCSTDHTSSILKRKNVPHINLPVNLGIGGAVETGFKYALINHYDYAVQVDGDGQHQPAEILKLYEAMVGSSSDIIIGSRFIKYDGFQSSTARRIGIRIFKGLIKSLCGINISDATSGFRLYNRKSIEFLADKYPDEYPEPESVVILHLNGFTISEVSVSMRERKKGKSSIRTLSGFYYMMKVSLSIIFSFLKYKYR